MSETASYTLCGMLLGALLGEPLYYLIRIALDECDQRRARREWERRR